MPRDWVGRVAGSTSLGPNMGLKELEKDVGLAKIDGPLGRNLKDKSKVAGDSKAGPSSSWAAELGCHPLVEVEGLERDGPTTPQEKASFLGRFISRKGSIPEDPLMSWVPEELKRKQRDDGFSMTDQALEEEAQRYVLISHPKGKKVMGIPLLLSSNSVQASEEESFDRPGGIEEELWGDKSTWLTVYEGNVENENGSWKLGEANKNRDKVKGKKGNTGASGSQDTKNEKEELWEDCSLAKFSQFLGFSMEGLEKKILNFLLESERGGKRFTAKNFWRSPSLKGN